MILKTKFFLILLVITTIVACGPSERELAVKKINTGKQILIAGDTIAAITRFDSVKVLYPNAEIQIEVAKRIVDELYRQLIDNRTIQLEHSELLISELEVNFEIEKTELDKYKQYIPKKQTFKRSWDRSFLQIHLDERGEIFLSSNYMGKEWLKHTGIRVYVGKQQAKSEKVELDDPNNHRSDFLDYKWEKISYRKGKADDVIQFIVDNSDKNLKCVFMGNRYYYILLEDYDIQAVKNAYLLSNAIKKKKTLQDEIQELSNKRNRAS